MTSQAIAGTAEPPAAGDQAWRRDGDSVVLVGQRCRRCGQMHFPKAAYCSACRAQDFEQAVLGSEGSLYSFAEVHVAPKNFTTPYIVGYVDLDGGLRVFGQIDGPADRLRLDGRVHVTWGRIRTDRDGRPVEGYRFRME